jgi:hypothetical protein
MHDGCGGKARYRSRWASVIALASGMAWGCTPFESGADQLVEAASLGQAWSCLARNDELRATPVFSRAVPRVVYSIQVVDLSSGNIYPDATIRACALTDVNCEAPVTDTLPVDAQGWVDIPLFRDFVGYLEITSPQTVPSMFYLTEPVLPQATTEFPLTMVSLASIGPLTQLVGVQLAPGTGIFATRSFDCEGNTASGVVLLSEADGVPWYFVDGLPSSMASATSADGIAGVVNVPPGMVLFETFAPNGASVAGRQSLVVRPNWLSTAFVKPQAREATVVQ